MKIKAYFEDHRTIIENYLKDANSEVIIAVAWINFKLYFSIFSELLDKQVKLKIICTDNFSNRRYQDLINKLSAKGASIKLLQMPTDKLHMHHKFAIIDLKIIINGSFNWTQNAVKCFENIIVIEDCKNEAKKFKEEFIKMMELDRLSIKSLQKFKRCKNCGGELLNILVYSERSTKYNETYGDIIEVCNGCEEYTIVNSCIQNSQLYILFNSLENSGDDFEYEFTSDLIFEEFNRHTNSSLHAVGKVRTLYNFDDQEDVETIIIWKNKFVGDRVPESFENDFGIYYDN